MRKSIRYPLGLFAVLNLVTTIAVGGPRIGNGELNFQASVSATTSDGVSPRANSPSDTILAFTPGLTYTSEGKRLKSTVNASVQFTEYLDNDYLNSENFDLSISGNVPYAPSSRLSGGWSLSYTDGVAQSFYTNSNQNLENLSASISSDVRFLSKLSFKSSFRYNDRSSSSIDFGDFSNSNETIGYTLGFHGRDFLGRAGGYVEYYYQERLTTGGNLGSDVDDEDDGINFGVTGQILPERLFPKLDADLSIGFTSTTRASGSEFGAKSDRLVMNGSLSYPATSKTNVSLGFSRSLAVTDDDRTVEASAINLGLNYTPNQKIGFSSGISYSSTDYIDDPSGRNDDSLSLNLRLRYSIRTNWSAAAFASFRDNSSNQAISDFSSSRFGVSTTIRY